MVNCQKENNWSDNFFSKISKYHGRLNKRFTFISNQPEVMVFLNVGKLEYYCHLIREVHSQTAVLLSFSWDISTSVTGVLKMIIGIVIVTVLNMTIIMY